VEAPVERVEVTGGRYVFDPSRDSFAYNDGSGLPLQFTRKDNGDRIHTYADGNEIIRADGTSNFEPADNSSLPLDAQSYGQLRRRIDHLDAKHSPIWDFFTGSGNVITPTERHELDRLKEMARSNEMGLSDQGRLGEIANDARAYLAGKTDASTALRFAWQSLTSGAESVLLPNSRDAAHYRGPVTPADTTTGMLKEGANQLHMMGQLTSPLGVANVIIGENSTPFEIKPEEAYGADVFDKASLFLGGAKVAANAASRLSPVIPRVIFSSSELGQLLGRGGNKDVFAYGNNRAVGILRSGKHPDLISDELRMLDDLDEVGLPTVNARRISVDGQPAIIMDQYAQGSKDIVRLQNGKVRITGDSPLLNEQSIADLQSIRKTMKEKNIKIDDLQFLIDKDGRIVVADPLKVYSNTPPSANNLRMIDLLIQQAEKNGKAQ